MENAVILSAQRTAVGSFQGVFANTTAPQLGSAAIQAALKSADIKPEIVQEVIMGQVLTGGAGQAPARQAALGAGISIGAVCMTINKVCGSGVKSVMLGADSIRTGQSEILVAGGQENMTLAPHLMENSRAGYRMGPVTIADSMLKDGLWDPYNNWHMGNAAELCVKEHSFTREAQDEFAIQSYKKAQAAMEKGLFKKEICPVEVKDRKGSVQIDKDEEPGKAMFDKMPGLKPAFDKAGTITAANASKINDGAAAVTIASETWAKANGRKPIARIVSYGTFAHDPKWFTTAPVGSIEKALKLANLSVKDIDLWEINEAFSVVTMFAVQKLGISMDRVNVHGGAVAIGHPIGASGTRLLTTAIHALHQYNKRYACVSLCIGGGEGVAIIVEKM